jgi:hypothetical protein
VGDNSIRVAVVVVGRVGQSSLVSMAVDIVEVGDPRGVFKREVSNRVRCLRMPVGVVGLGPTAFRGLLVFGIMGECRRSARGKETASMRKPKSTGVSTRSAVGSFRG